MKKTLAGILVFLTLGIFLSGCGKDKPAEYYYPLPGNQWSRFNILRFEIPVEMAGKSWDISFFARVLPVFSHSSIDFNMNLKTPSGEERINEYHLEIRSGDEKMLGKPLGEAFETEIYLKRQLHVSKPGTLLVELENIIPRMQAEGIAGVGIRIKESTLQD